MSLNILVVDDSRMMRTVLIRTLHISGLPVGEVHEATNGQEGLDQLAKNWIDLALVDINMPIMDGETMIDHMRANPLTKETPVVVISTESSPVSSRAPPCRQASPPENDEARGACATRARRCSESIGRR